MTLAHITHRMATLAAVALVGALLAAPAAGQARDAGEPRPPQDTAKPAPAGSLVNLNTATADQLEALPGIGPAMATRILEYREKNGPFKKVEDLMQIKGIGEKAFLKLKPLVSITAPRERPTN